jgi:uracil-DNA glycosylase
MTKHLFDTGYGSEPFRTLCEEYPDESVYPKQHFRVEWGPIFHRGRLDGSARILVIGQDPAQNENIVRRILVGEAGQRIQGFLAKLGIERSYVMINTYLYSVYGSAPAKVRRDPRLTGYRNQWLDALLVGTNVEAVLALGMLAEEAWIAWKATPQGQQLNLPFVRIPHPTQPESSSKGDKAKLKEATRKMLSQWNAALQTLHLAIQHPDAQRPLTLYGDAFAEGDKHLIPDFDLPAGLPVWMREKDGWARRVGTTDQAKRANITLTVPKDFLK